MYAHGRLGTFKQQHDTGQNAKVVIVYPRVSCASSSSVGAGGGKAEGGEMVNTKSPEYIACAADLDSFKQKVALKVSQGDSWGRVGRQCGKYILFYAGLSILDYLISPPL